MQDLRKGLLLLAISIDIYVSSVLYEEWFSACEFSIQTLVLFIIMMGLPTTLLVESVRVSYSFRKSFLVELFAGVAAMILLFYGTHVILKHADSTCTLTAPRLWRICWLSVCFTWTGALVCAFAMILTTVVVLLIRSPKSAGSVVPTNHKFKTYYGTL